jgi:hypothetical protein
VPNAKACCGVTTGRTHLQEHVVHVPVEEDGTDAALHGTQAEAVALHLQSSKCNPMLRECLFVSASVYRPM